MSTPFADLDHATAMTRQKLPIGIQTFHEIREDGCYYADKTAFALRLIEQGKYYFLSRPRRFGKSLFLDTLAELFAANEVLFRGLRVHGRWDWSIRYPVIHISFGGGVIGASPEPLTPRAELDKRILTLLQRNRRTLGLDEWQGSDVVDCFTDLIEQAHAKTGRRVVVLVDEYDKPILDNLTRPEAAAAIRDGLRNLYSVIKDTDAHIRFAFLTGVSKFSKVSLFSGLNNLNDITVDASYSAICGYTEADLDEVFGAELDGLDRAEIRRWYNGYNWTGESVYNPFDVLLLFQKRTFRPWWFETGTPTFLIDLLTERATWLPRLGQLETDAALLSAFEVGNISTEALMFQTGYLTIDAEEQLSGAWFYRLRYPNQEVYQSLNTALLEAWTPRRTDPGQVGISQDSVGKRRSLYRLLLANDFDGLEALIGSLFAGIPNEWFTNNPIGRYEGYYASVFYAYFASLGLDIVAEESSNAGRLDLALRFNGQRYLFEFKVVELEPDGRALEQIKARGYADKYRGEGLPIHLIGVEFSRERRALAGFQVESLGAGH